MLRKLFVWSLFGLVAVNTLAFSTDLVHGEILIFGAQSSAPAGPKLPTGVPGEPIPLQIQCWQYGVLIIDETGLDGVRVRDLIEGGGIGLQGDTWEYGDVNILPVNDTSTCLIKPVP